MLTGLLRNELGYKGLIVTDAMDMQGVTSLFSQGEAAVRAVEAGADVILMPSDPAACIRGLLAAVKSGRISQRRIDESAAKILAAKQRVGLYRSRTVSLDRLADSIKDPEWDKMAQKAADESITLVKNEKAMFPVSDPANSCLLMLTDGRFSSRGETLISQLAHRSPAMKTYLANSAMPDEELSALAAIVGKCKQIYIAASITVAPNRGSVALEGGLSGMMEALIKSGQPVALMSLGSPYLLRNFPGVSAYIAAFSTSNTSEIALAKAISGDIPIRGKLPVSIPGLAKIGDGIEVSRTVLAASKP